MIAIYFSAAEASFPSSITTGTAASRSHTRAVSSQPIKDNSNSEELITISSDCLAGGGGVGPPIFISPPPFQNSGSAPCTGIQYEL